MLDPRICPSCGDRADHPIVRGESLECASCGKRSRFNRIPLFALTGPSGGGKSTVAPVLANRLRDRFVVLEQDVLWVLGLRDDRDGHPAFRSTWLRMAAMIHQSGRPVVLCGTVVPAEFESLPERPLFSAIHYLALTAEPEVLTARLRARPAWREWDEPRIAEMLEFDDWLRSTASTMTPSVRLLDTTTITPESAADAVCSWVREHTADHDGQ